MIAGLFHVWALVHTTMHRVTVQVPRVIYINISRDQSFESDIAMMEAHEPPERRAYVPPT
jgi:hypothetical protein